MRLPLSSLEKFTSRFDLMLHGGVVAIFHEFHKPPYGGGNQFLLALKGELEKASLSVSANRVGNRTRVVLFNSFNFDFAAIRRLKGRGLKMIHRVDGPISVYRGTDMAIDREIFELNQEIADATIFQSQYSYQKHVEMGLNFKNVSVIPNAIDALYFYRSKTPLLRAPKLRLIGSAWSSNPKKGLSTYMWLDKNLDFSKYSVTFVGRTEGTFKNIQVISAQPSRELGDLLRGHDVYLAPSVDDPCSNALIEALACGLPAVFRKSGGHPELVGAGGLGFNEFEEIPALLEQLSLRLEEYRSRVSVHSLVDVALQYRRVMGI